MNYAQANAYVEQDYLAEHNRRYARPAAEAADYHRRRPTARQLDAVLWLEEERAVSEDWVVRYHNRVLQLERQAQHWAPARSRVVVRESQTGEIAIAYRGQRLGFRDITMRGMEHRERRGSAPSPAPPSPNPPRCVSGSRPASDHPWKQPYQHMKTPTSSAAWQRTDGGTFLLWRKRGHFYCGMTKQKITVDCDVQREDTWSRHS